MNTFGDKTNPALIFVHGGPGYDSQDFEISTAALLAQNGFYVILYDQRGQGRSDLAQASSEYSYKRYSDDLQLIIKNLAVDKPALIGHSHGGPIALKFDQFYPGVASKIILVSAPVDFLKSMDSIGINCKARFASAGDIANLNKITEAFSILNGQPSKETEIGAIADIFGLASVKPCDLYAPSQPTKQATDLRAQVAKLRVPVMRENLYLPMGNFVVNENYIHVDRSTWVQDNAEHIFGIYGAEDGLFIPSVLAEIESDLAANPKAYRFQLIPAASHAVYIDQREKFIEAILRILK